MAVEVFTVPVENQVLIYRPLRRLAFMGNFAMAALCHDLASGERNRDDVPDEIMAFLNSIEFLTPDPPVPTFPPHDFRPTSAVLLMTNRCNLRCTYCYANAGMVTPADLSLELAQTIIDTVAESAMEQGRDHFEVCFHGGGEPTQNWRTMQEATAYAREKSIPANIVTVSNGVWSSTQLDWVLNNLNGVTISFDGRPQTQDSQRILPDGTGSSRHVLKTIAALDAAKFGYGIRMTATAPWRTSFPEDVRFICENTGCKTIQVEPAFNTERGTHEESNHEQSEAFVEAFMEAFEIAAYAGRELTYSGARPWLHTRTFCTAPYDALIVNANGDLVTCYEIASDAHLLAQISKTGQVTSKGKIVLDPIARENLLNRLENKQHDQCADCFCKYHCAGDCYTRSTVADNGNLSVSTARCHTNREITAQLLMWYIMAGNGVWQGQNILTVPKRQC